MNKAKFFKGVNIFLSLVLLVALAVIVWLLWQSNQTKESEMKDQVKKEVSDSEDELSNAGDLIVIDIDKDDEIKVEDKEANAKENKEDTDIQDNDSNNVDKDDKKDDEQDGNEDSDEKTYRGILMKAEDDNDYGGNYKLMNEGDTQYTYFWFNSGYAKNGVDNMVGQMVEIDVLIGEDGTFTVTDGPKIV